jgi:hypothetical protein
LTESFVWSWPNQALHLTVAAHSVFRVQSLTGRRGGRALTLGLHLEDAWLFLNGSEHSS